MASTDPQLLDKARIATYLIKSPFTILQVSSVLPFDRVRRYSTIHHNSSSFPLWVHLINRRPMLYPDELRALKIKIGRGREIRTPDPLLPKQLRYQAALYPVIKHQLYCKVFILSSDKFKKIYKKSCKIFSLHNY